VILNTEGIPDSAIHAQCLKTKKYLKKSLIKRGGGRRVKLFQSMVKKKTIDVVCFFTLVTQPSILSESAKSVMVKKKILKKSKQKEGKRV